MAWGPMPPTMPTVRSLVGSVVFWGKEDIGRGGRLRGGEGGGKGLVGNEEEI